jgi:competence protein ComEC
MLMLSLTGFSSASRNATPTVSSQQTEVTKEVPKQKENTSPVSNVKKVVNDNVKVHFIDVDQADSILVQQANSSLLIDAGNKRYSSH